MPTETVHFENPRLAQQLFNHEPRNLQALEQELAVKAVAREEWIKLEGAVEDIARAREMFRLLEKSLKAGGVVRNREFAQALSVVKNDGVGALRNLLAERIVTSPRKAAVLPKTIGQKKYVDAIRAHDVTFGIGPAGTGKTYLAMAMALAALQEEKVARIILTRPAVEAGEALGFLPGRSLRKNHALPAAAARRPARHAARRGNPETDGARGDRNSAAGLHARAHAQQRLHHPGRGAEFDGGTDVYVLDAPGDEFQGGHHRRHHPN